MRSASPPDTPSTSASPSHTEGALPDPATEREHGDLLPSSLLPHTAKRQAAAAIHEQPEDLLHRRTFRIETGAPTGLRSYAQWVVWRYELRPGKDGGVTVTKVPHQPRASHRPASVRAPSTWAAYETAVAAYQSDPTLAGIGFVLTPSDPFVGIDLDHMVDFGTNDVDQDLLDDLFALGTYTELSPSQKGVRAFIKGTLTSLKGRKRGNIELYDQGRFLTVTGELFRGGREIANDQAALEAFHRKHFPRPASPPVSTVGVVAPVVTRPVASDEHLLEGMFASKNGASIRALFEGDVSGYASRSEADLALASHLAWWTNYDLERADRLFRRSGLHRAKWDEERGDATYGRMTLAKAFEGRRAGGGYTGSDSRPDNAAPATGDAAPQKEDATPQKEDATPETGNAASGKDDTAPAETSLTSFARTDMGNGDRLVHHCGDDLMWTPGHGWRVWNGRCWGANDLGQVQERAKGMVRAYEEECRDLTDSASRDAHLRHAHRSAGLSRINAAIGLASTDPHITRRDEQLDQHPWLLNVANGTLDLRTGELRPHRREDLLTRLTPVTYDPHAACPRWEAFQLEIANGDTELVRFKQKLWGYALTGMTTEQLVVIAKGDGANGKSTELEVLKSIAGPYAATASFAAFTPRPTDDARYSLAALRGARLVSASEGEIDQAIGEAALKNLSGEEAISCRHPYGALFTYQPEFLVVLVTNHLPVVRGGDEAIWRRLVVVPYDAFIPPEKRDRNLRENLLKEAPGVLAWLVHGCLAWQRDGLGLPESVKKASGAYRGEMDVVSRFMSECLQGERDARLKNPEVYEVYKAWCRNEDVSALSQKKLTQGLEKRGLKWRMSNGKIWLDTGLTAEGRRLLKG